MNPTQLPDEPNADTALPETELVSAVPEAPPVEQAPNPDPAEAVPGDAERPDPAG